MAWLAMIGMVAAIAGAALERVRWIRRVEAFAELAGVVRLPGETTTALHDRAVRRFVPIRGPR